jgi:dihydrofolate reductase
MAITPNGMIAKEDNDCSWVTETVWEGYSGMIKKAGNMIIGRRTYEVMLKNDEFNISNLNEIKTVVLSKNLIKVHNPKFVSVTESPQEALNILKKQGFKTIMVCGGGELNASFMKENLIDEIYLDIESIIFGRGIRLFAEANFETKLELIGIKKLSKNEVQLHYKVKK